MRGIWKSRPAGRLVVEATAAPSPSAPRLTFRPDIEGLRAVAVGLVVALHAGVTRISGGYVGVDVFFVISGFLITSLLIDEVRATDRVSILGFYARRARRILPVACFVIAAVVVATYLQLGPLAGRSAAIDGQWAAGFAANIGLIRHGTDYFASNLPPSPLQHFWSLAVEEQFYLVWPTALFGLVLLGRRFSKSSLALTLGLVAIVSGSLFWSIHEGAAGSTTAYFSPFTRAWELGVGALVAVFSIGIAKTPARVRSLATWIGLALIGVAAFTFTATTAFPGSAALLPVVGAALVVAGGIGAPPCFAAAVLGLAPMRWLGKISFSLYLWHWPVLIIADERSPAPLTNPARLACVGITLALSIASYVAIEQPLRSTGTRARKAIRTDWQKARPALLLGATAIVVAVSASVLTNTRATHVIDAASSAAAPGHRSTITAPPSPASNPAKAVPTTSAADQIAQMQQTVRALVQEGLALHTVPAGVEPPVLQLASTFNAKYRACLQERKEVVVRTCISGNAASARTLVVFGDSHSMQWMPAVDIYGKHANYRVVSLYKGGCPVPSVDVFSGTPVGAPPADAKPFPQCSAWRASALRYIHNLKPAAIIVAFGLDKTSPRGFDLDLWLTGLRTSLRALRESNAPVVEIGNNPYLPSDLGLCLTRPAADPADCTGAFMRAYHHNDDERAVVESMGATYIDLQPWFCIDERCPVIIDNRIAYADYAHLSEQYVSDLEPLLAASLRAAGFD